jgi:hypothetical protein
MNRPLNSGRLRVRKPILALAVFLALAACALGWAEWRRAADRRLIETDAVTPAAASPISDTAVQSWRVVPSPAPRRRGLRVSPPVPPPAPETDWSALSADVSEARTGARVPLEGPADLSSGLSRSERERLIAAGDGREASPKGCCGGTGVIARGTPRTGGGGTCY